MKLMSAIVMSFLTVTALAAPPSSTGKPDAQWKISTLQMIDLVKDGYRIVAMSSYAGWENGKTGLIYVLQKDDHAFRCEEWTHDKAPAIVFLCAELVKPYMQGSQK